jgi:subtilisin family serine protease
MEKCFDCTKKLWKQLEPLPEKSALEVDFDRPARIAIIDTGVDIEHGVLDQLYDNRLTIKDCITLVGAEPGPSHVFDTLDLVGHGTHAVSLVLDITLNTDCEVYAAQVFRDDPQKGGSGANNGRTIEEGIASVGQNR